MQTAKDQRQLLISLSNSDIEAFNSIFLSYQPKVLRFINGFIKDTETSKDLCEDIFMKIWLYRSRMDKVENLNSFLFKMAHNAIINYLSHCKISQEYENEVLNSPIVAENGEDVVFLHMLQEDIDKALSTLSEQRRNVFILSRNSGLSNAEIATQLNISKRTVENHISASLLALRKALKNFIMLFI